MLFHARCLQVSGVLEYAHMNKVEPFLEPTVELALALLRHDAADVPAGARGAGSTQHFVQNAHSFTAFAGVLKDDASLAAAAAECTGLVAEVCHQPLQRVYCNECHLHMM
jgi:hypothetical protein